QRRVRAERVEAMALPAPHDRRPHHEWHEPPAEPAAPEQALHVDVRGGLPMPRQQHVGIVATATEGGHELALQHLAATTRVGGNPTRRRAEDHESVRPVGAFGASADSPVTTGRTIAQVAGPYSAMPCCSSTAGVTSC